MGAKRIAVLVRDRQAEALRMALGLLLLDDTVDVYVLGPALEATEETAQHLEAMREFETAIYSDSDAGAGAERLTTEEIARRLAGYDHVLAY